MSEPAAKQRPIDLDEFERRLRAPAAAASSQDDPLAELARLVGGNDRFRTQAAGLPKATYQPLVGSPRDWHRQEPAPEAFDSLPLRRVLPETSQDYSDDPAAYEEEELFSQGALGDDRPPHSRRAPMILGGVLVLVLAGIAVTFAMRQHAPVGGEAPTIKAAAGPTKVQPATQDNVDVADRNASLLDRSNADHVSSSHVVDHAEQPIDLKAVNLQRSAAAGAPVGAVPQPAHAAAPPVPNSAASYFPEPVRVRTVSVRPDGTIIADDPAPQPPVRSVTPVAAPSPVSSAALGALPASPNAAASVPPPQPKAAVPMTPKTTARVVTTPKDTTGFNGPASGAAAEVLLAGRPVAPAPAKPTRIAAVEPSDGAKAGPLVTTAAGGTFSVQLAAPASEQEAHEATARLERKFSAELRGRRTAVVKADINGRTVYRVRVVGLTSDDANVLCSRLKAGGGACFVARD